MLTPWNISRVLQFQKTFGGSIIHPAGHALVTLGESVELAIASGASSKEIVGRVWSELRKAQARSEVYLLNRREPDRAKMREEAADVLITMAIFTQGVAMKPNGAVEAKLPVLFQRKWTPDADGVLRRKREGE